MIYPCYGCANRVVGCHANCERYLTAAAQDRENRMVNDAAKRHRAGKGKLNTLKR